MTTPVPLAGVIGQPAGHSRSPRLHNGWLADLGIAGHYVPLEVRPEDLADVLAALPEAGFVGANVTSPHKETALALAAAVSDRARRIGAANTLVFRPGGGFDADCTDGEGFIANLRAAAPDWSAGNGPVAVFGAGGAARAVLDALVADGATEIRLANRTRARADMLAATFGPAVRVIDWASATDAVDGAATVVNTTSLGMRDKPPFDVSLDALQPGALANDLVYAPLDTPFLQAARARGAHTVDGLGILIHQAVPGFERWFGTRPTVTQETRTRLLDP